MVAGAIGDCTWLRVVVYSAGTVLHFFMPVESILSHYWDLASTDEGIRLKAASELLSALSLAQSEHEKHARQDGVTASLCCKELDYSFKRLVKGLASSRKGARQGFTTVLTEVLSNFECLPPETVISMLSETLQISTNAKSQEGRDSYIGHVFGLMALVRANTTVTASGVMIVKGAPWLTQVVTTLRSISTKKSYMQEFCAKTITDIFALVSPGDFQDYILPALQDSFEVGWNGANTDALFLMLVAQKLFQEQLKTKAIRKVWGKSFIFGKDNYEQLARVLQDSINVHPRVHCVWKELLSTILRHPESDVELFWSTVIDEGLFQSTHDRKFLGFQLVRMVLPQIKPGQVKIIFSCHMMRCFMNSLSSSQSYLHDAAKHLASLLGTEAAKNPDSEVTSNLIQWLLGSHGNVQFDKFTKTRTVDNLLGSLRGAGLHGHISWLLKLFGDGQTDSSPDTLPSVKDVESTRVAVLNQLFTLLKNKNLLQSGEEDKVKEVVFFLLDLSYFQPAKKVKKWKVSLSPAVKQVCEQRFTSALRDLTSHPQGNHKKGQKASDSDGPAQFPWIYHIVQHAKELLEDGELKVASPSWSDEAEKSFKKTVKIVEKIHKKNKGGAKNYEDEAFELLFSHVALQLFSEAKQAEDVLKELKACYEKRKEKGKAASSDDDEEPQWVEVLTEILLSLLTRQSSLYRHLVDHVFTVISPHLTPTALAMILEAVDPRKGTGEDDEVLEVADESDDDGDDDEGVDEDEDMETDDEGSESSNSESDEDDDEDESAEEGEEENGVDEAFRADVQAALGPAAVDLDEEGSRADNDDSDDDGVSDDLDDEAMMRIDEALAAAFKSHLKSKQKNKDRKDAKKMLLHFKLRVLDVIEIFIKKQPSNPLILDLVEPLLDIAWTSLNHKDFQPLGERAQAIYKNKLCAPKELPQAVDTDAEACHERIKRLISKALSAPALPVVSLISRGALFMIRVLRSSVAGHKTKKRDHRGNMACSSENLGAMDESRVAEVYKEALTDFMEKRSTHVHPVLFTELINRFPSVAWQLAPDLVQYLEKAVNNFRKSQACVMLTQLLSQKVPDYHKHLKKISASLQEAVESILHQSAASETPMKAKHVKEILKLTTKFIKEGNSGEEGGVLSLDNLGEALRSTMDSSLASRSLDIKRTCSRLLPLTGCAVENVSPVKKARKEKKSDETNKDGHEPQETKDAARKQKKKKKKRKI